MGDSTVRTPSAGTRESSDAKRQGSAGDEPRDQRSRGNSARLSTVGDLRGRNAPPSPSHGASTRVGSISEQRNGRAMSMVPRRGSRLTSMRAEEPFRPVTAEEVVQVFSFLSSDGKRVTRDDVRAALERYFPTLSNKLVKMVTAGKEEMTRDALTAMLVSRGGALDYFEETFQFFEPSDSGLIPDSTLKRLLKEINEHKMPYKGDIAAIKRRFDRDRDGELNLDDFKRMNMKPMSA